MKHSIGLFLAALFFITACVQQKRNVDPPTLGPPSVEDNYNANTTILMLDERLSKVDSLVFIYYKDPLGKDSLRYTRYYSQYSSTQEQEISILKNQISKPTERLEKVKKCRSEGKIWCFTKGEIFQTLYFSDFGGGCSFLFFIKNGQFYYCMLSLDFKEMIFRLKPFTKELQHK